MSRDWKPGDVAMVTVGGRSGIGVRGNASWSVALDGYTNIVGDDMRASARPLVVIDPEDREQVERLVRDYFADWHGRPAAEKFAVGGTSPYVPMPGHIDSLQAALREFANPTPPKPDEPTSPLAIVEDASGLRWYRMPEKRVPDHLWAAFDESGEYDRDWSDIDAVRVVFEGVQP